MDVYLPADFRELHAAAPDDWRDLSSSCSCAHDDARSVATVAPPGRPDCADPDPLWRVL